jgi:DNA-binding transcriptional MocR family regulator
MAANFTTSELSILSVIADEVRKRGALVWAVDRIAATAGVSRSMVQKTYAKAERMGLIEVDRVRPAGMRNLYNKVRIKCSDWLAWIRGRGGKKNSMTTNKQDLSIEGPQAAKPCIDRDSNPYHPHGNVRFPVLHLDNGIPRVLSKGAVRSRL